MAAAQHVCSSHGHPCLRAQFMTSVAMQTSCGSSSRAPERQLLVKGSLHLSDGRNRQDWRQSSASWDRRADGNEQEQGKGEGKGFFFFLNYHFEDGGGGGGGSTLR